MMNSYFGGSLLLHMIQILFIPKIPFLTLIQILKYILRHNENCLINHRGFEIILKKRWQLLIFEGQRKTMQKISIMFHQHICMYLVTKSIFVSRPVVGHLILISLKKVSRIQIEERNFDSITWLWMINDWHDHKICFVWRKSNKISSTLVF